MQGFLKLFLCFPGLYRALSARNYAVYNNGAYILKGCFQDLGFGFPDVKKWNTTSPQTHSVDEVA